MENRSEKKVRKFTSYATLAALIMCSALLGSFTQNCKTENFDEINVKRINLIAEDGSLRMVLSNENRQHPGRINGKDLEKRERPAGIIFFNTEGDECGGIIQYGKTEDGLTQSGMSFTMDQYKEDQVIQILNGETYKDGKANIVRGISISDIPLGSDLLTRMKKIEDIRSITDEKERNKRMAEAGNSLSSKQRLFIGRNKHNSSGIFLSGPDGKQKIKIFVDENGQPRFEIIDEKGEPKNILEAK